MADLMTMALEGDWAQGLDALGAAAHNVKRSGGNAMAEVFQEEAKVRAPVYKGERKFIKTRTGGYWIRPGQLRDAIYRVYAKGASDDTTAVYEVSWNHGKAPHGYWMENGNSRHAAHPFVRPAFEAMKYPAISAGQQRLQVRFSEELMRIAK